MHLTGYHMPMYEGGDQPDDDDEDEDSDDEELMSQVGVTPRRACDEGGREGGAGNRISPIPHGRIAREQTWYGGAPV